MAATMYPKINQLPQTPSPHSTGAFSTGCTSLVQKKLKLNLNLYFKFAMDSFKDYLQQEFLRRNRKNEKYSLRAFAQHLGMNHATLSGILSGKRAITEPTFRKLAPALNLSPHEMAHFLDSNPKTERKKFLFSSSTRCL